MSEDNEGLEIAAESAQMSVYSLLDTNDELEAENQQLKARIARLEQPYTMFGKEGATDAGLILAYESVVNESPQQSIAAIQADAVELIRQAVPAILADCGNSYANKWTENWLQGAKNIGAYDGDVVGVISDLTEAQQLRQQGKEKL